MKTCLVSLVSDQTIPNILVALRFKPDVLLFVSTKKMEEKGKVQAILKCLEQRGEQYSQPFHMVLVDENSLVDFERRIEEWLNGVGEDYRFIVNLTGGNKLMSLAAYQFFADYESTMVYVPIPKNEFLTPFPKRRFRASEPLIDRLSVSEYLVAYGFEIPDINSLEQNKVKALGREDKTRWIYEHYREIRPFLEWFYGKIKPIEKMLKKSEQEIVDTFPAENEEQKHLLDFMGFKRNGLEISCRVDQDLWLYLRGGWLEERIFLALQSILPPQSDVQLGVKYKDSIGNANEMDVVFCHENALNLVECKSLNATTVKEDELGGKMSGFLYKLAALRQGFGLTPRGFLATTAEDILTKDKTIQPHLLERAKANGLTLVALLQVANLEAEPKRIVLGQN